VTNRVALGKQKQWDGSHPTALLATIGPLMSARRRETRMVMTTYSQRQYERGSVAVAKEAVFTVKLESELRDAFMAEAAANHVPASQLVREFMRDFVKRQRKAREYDEYYRRAVAKGLEDVAAGRFVSQEDVEAESASWRAEALARLNGHTE
jgi:predicted transcriptional regulator